MGQEKPYIEKELSWLALLNERSVAMQRRTTNPVD